MISKDPKLGTTPAPLLVISAKAAIQSLGCRAKSPIRSLVTGCASEIQFHALEDGHIVFALNNSIYRLSRAATAAEPAKSSP